MTYSFKPLTETKLVILDHDGLHRSYIIQALKDYKSRWGESLATNVLVATTTAEVPPYIPVIVTTYYYDELPSLFTNVITVDSLQFLTRNHLRQAVINPQVTYTKDPVEALALLNSLKSPFAYDCETAKADNVEPIKKVKLALDPFRNQLTMFSFADNESTAFVISNESKEMEDLVLNFLTSTSHKVIMHNSSFDMKIVKHRTGKFIKNFEDSLLMHRILLNHTGDSNQTLVGLKKLAGSVYGSWAVAKDLFGIEHKYNPELIHYSGIDAMATMYVYNEALASGEFNNLPDNFPQMDNSFFPIGKPQKMRHTKNFFYTNIVKPQIPATIDLMLQGITIDFNAVTKLSTTVDTVVQQVLDNLHNNKRVQQFLQEQTKLLKSKYIQSKKEKLRSINNYIQPFKPDDIVHRSYYVEQLNLNIHTDDTLPNGHPKWSVRQLKPLVHLHPDLQLLLDKTLQTTPEVQQAMIKLAQDKADKFNKSYLQAINDVDTLVTAKFNPGSSKQKTALFDFLGIEPLAYSKDTNEPSWERKYIEEVNKTTTDPDIKLITDELIEYSFGAIIKQTFIPSFNKFVVNGNLRGDYIVGGAKTWRYTSKNPNMLNQPSSKSKYAKPLKYCLTAPEGYLVATADFSGLEDRILANLSNDEGKCSIIEKKLDSHIYNALVYFEDEISKEFTLTDSHDQNAVIFKELMKKGNTKLEAIRSRSKAPTFKLAYLGNIDSDIGGSITPEIYDKYHNVLYTGVRDYINNYVLVEANKHNEVYLGLGLSIKTSNPKKDFRTLHNATCQFWSILTVIALTTVYRRIQEDNMQDKIQCVSTIYDSIYYNCKADAETVNWLNRELISAMSVDFLVDQRIKNEASLEIGHNWGSLTELPNNATLDEISEIIRSINEQNN